MQNHIENQTIYRSPHNASNRFFIASQALARDGSLSFACRGMLLYLLSMQDNWIIRPKQIAACAEKDGRDAVYSLIKEAIEHGYLVREEYLEGGLRRIRYALVEDPKSLIIYPRPGNPDPGKQDAASLYKEESCEEISSSSFPEGSPPPSTQSEYSKEEEEEFEKVMEKRKREGREPVKNMMAYKKKVIESIRERRDEEGKKEREKENVEERRERRKRQAERWPDYHYDDGYTVRVLKTHVEICKDRKCDIVSFDASKEEWNALCNRLQSKANGPSEVIA